MWTTHQGAHWIGRVILAGRAIGDGLRLSAAMLLLAATISPTASAAQDNDAVDPHAHHHHNMSPETTRSTVNYTVPDVKLVRDDGKTVMLGEELNDGRPVVLTFIYTSCTTVCPMTSHTLAQLETKLGSAKSSVHLMSITIDPEQDTPQRLHEYAKSYSAGPEWQHYTGSLAASQTAQRAFDVYRGNKMNHAPAMLVRTAPGAPWVRIDGFATADQLLAELSNVRVAR